MRMIRVHKSSDDVDIELKLSEQHIVYTSCICGRVKVVMSNDDIIDFSEEEWNAREVIEE